MANLESLGIDFNLVKHLESLLLSKNVSVAAKRVGITQPAMSNSLAKIRKFFEDPILVRTKTGYVLTPFAESLLPKAQLLMRDFEDVFFERSSFDPGVDQVEFHIAVSDAAGFVFGPRIVHGIGETHPNITVNLRPLVDYDALDEGHISLVIASTLDRQMPGRLYTRHLCEEPFAVAGCGEHLKGIEQISLADYVSGSHLEVEARGLDNRAISHQLAVQGYERRITGGVSHFMVGIQSILKTPHYLTLPRLVLQQAAIHFPIKVFQLPFDLPPVHHILLWHERTGSDESHVWLRQAISGLFPSG